MTDTFSERANLIGATLRGQVLVVARLKLLDARDGDQGEVRSL